MRGGLLLVAIFIFAPIVLVAQSVRVLVPDALNGKPQSGVEVHYYCQSETRNFFPVDLDITNPEGIALVSHPCQEDQKIVFFVTALPKEECGGEPSLTFKEISEAGIINPPDAAGEMHCPTKISRKLKPVPGQVIIFIKKPSWFQYRFGG